jgi:hypothetical protein
VPKKQLLDLQQKKLNKFFPEKSETTSEADHAQSGVDYLFQFINLIRDDKHMWTGACLSSPV